MPLWTQGVVNGLRSLSDSTLVDRCIIRVYNSETNANPNISNRGGPKREFIREYTEIPCRMDTNISELMPQRSKANIDESKILRIIYISYRTVQSIGYLIKERDEIETSAGNPLGIGIKYTVMEVNLETEEADIAILVEEAAL